MIETAGDNFKLLIIIVKKNLSRAVIQACKDAGAEGGTVLNGRGTGTHDTGSIFGVKVEPKKDIILCLTPSMIIDNVVESVRKSVKLNEPGTGIAFVINSKSICGIAHLLNDDFSNSN